MRTNVERVLDYLRLAGHQGATNAEICQATGVEPHQQVYMITQKLKDRGLVISRRYEREWVFSIVEKSEEMLRNVSNAHQENQIGCRIKNKAVREFSEAVVVGSR